MGRAVIGVMVSGFSPAHGRVMARVEERANRRGGGGEHGG